MSVSKFQSRLREVIHALKIEHQEFARAGGITKATLSGYVQSDRQPKADTLGKWVETYGVNANWLLTGKGGMFLKEGECASSQTEAPQTPMGQELEEIKQALQNIGATESEIKEAMLNYVNAGGRRLLRAGSDHDQS